MQSKYRPNAAAIVLSKEYPFACKVLIAERTDIEGAWQFPQGGIDDGETPKEAVLRELEEEIGTRKVEIVAECGEWFNYDFPSDVKKIGNFRGQTQRYFLVRLKDGAKINLKTKHPEFCAYKFVDVASVLKSVTAFKKGVYIKALRWFKERGYL